MQPFHKLSRFSFLSLIKRDDLLRQELADATPTPMEYKDPKPQAVLDADREIARWPLAIAADAVQVVPVVQMFER